MVSTVWISVGITAVGTCLAIIASVRKGRADARVAAESMGASVDTRIEMLLDESRLRLADLEGQIATLRLESAEKDVRIAKLERAAVRCQARIRELTAQLKAAR